MGKNANNKNEKKKNDKMWKVMDIIVPLFCAVIFIGGGLQILHIRSEYNVAVEEYNALQDYVEVEEEPLNIEETQKLATENVEGPHFLNLNVDFGALNTVNSDVVGWLYLPALDLSYPVVQGEDNDYYLHRTYENTPNSSGSIFLDFESKADMSDRNTFVYGHNMKNGSMFGSMKQFRTEPELVDANPYVYYYTPDHAYQYKIFAFYIAKIGGEAYFNFFTDAQYDDYMDKVHTKNEYAKGNEEDLSTRKNILTLSTCSGLHSKNRMVTHCVLVDEYKID